MSKGGFKAFRGSARTATEYLLERDSVKLDDYYREGSERTVEHGVVSRGQVEMGTFTPEEFRTWMEHRDPETDDVRGVFRPRSYVDTHTGEVKVGGTPLYQETLVSVDKTLSLYAAANPEFAAILERVMGRATTAGVAALSEKTVTRIGARNAQRQVKFDRIEFTSVQHTTSRSGDPHYHRHVQLLTVGMVNGEWRGLAGQALYRNAALFNKAADLAISTDVEMREYLATQGLTWTPGDGGGQIVELLGQVDDFSERRDMIELNREERELEWRMANPGEEPSQKLRQSWDTYAWAKDRPTKEPQHDLTPEGMAARIAAITPMNTAHTMTAQTAAEIDPAVVAEGALVDLSSARSAWSQSDMIAAIDDRLAGMYLIGSEGVPELRKAALSQVLERCISFLDEGIEVVGSRHYTSGYVVELDRKISDALTMRAMIPGDFAEVNPDRDGFTLSQEQQIAAEAIAGTHQLVVIQGAAGAGKTTMLEAAAESIEAQGRKLMVVSPTKRGAIEAGDVLGVDGDSVHALLYRAGATVDETGRWELPEVWRDQPEAWRMGADTVLVVDEAGMLDQETAAALHAYVDSQRVGTLVLSGDAAQLAAVGRGGYLARAAQLAGMSLDLTDVRRFRTDSGDIDQKYAEMSLLLRDRTDTETVFEELAGRGLVQVSELETQIENVSESVALEVAHGKTSVVITATNSAASRVNRAVFDRLVDAGGIDVSVTTIGRDGDPIAAGALVATRQNDRELGVANRQTWLVDSVNADGRVTVKDPNTGHRRTLSAEYVASNVQLAYAVTGHGAQGMTVDVAHTLLSDEMNASGAYVGLTRGRFANVLHVVGEDLDDAKTQFLGAFDRDEVDLGLESALEQVERDIEGLDIADRSHIDAAAAQLREQADAYDAKAAEALQHVETLQREQAEFKERARQLGQDTRQLVEEKTEAVTAREQQEARLEQVRKTYQPQAYQDGFSVLEARAAAEAATQAARDAGIFARRSAERAAAASITEFQAKRDEVTQRWGSAPEPGDLTEWAKDAAEQHPDVVKARRDQTRAAVAERIAGERSAQKLKGRDREMDTLRFEVFGSDRRDENGNPLPMREETAAEWEQGHQKNAAAFTRAAEHSRTEADTLDSLPVDEAEARLKARENQTKPEPRKLSRSEVFAMQQQQLRAEQERAQLDQQRRGRGITR